VNIEVVALALEVSVLVEVLALEVTVLVEILALTLEVAVRVEVLTLALEVAVLVEVLATSLGERATARPLSGEGLFSRPYLLQSMGRGGGGGGQVGALGTEPILVSCVCHHHVLPLWGDIRV